MSNIKVYVVGPQTGYARWIQDAKLVNDISKADLVFFTGGADVDPSVYHCKRHESVWSSPQRDIEELNAWKQISKDQLVFGTCRGYQLINCLYGGILIQDVDNHWCCGTHSITNGEQSYQVTSLHHQMIYPFDLDPEDYDILYWSTKRRSKRYEGDKIDVNKIKCEPEMGVFHRKGLPTCIGVQGHPEMMDDESEFVLMLNEFIKNYL